MVSQAEAKHVIRRPPGTPHGPLVWRTGYLRIEVQCFAERAGLSDYLDRKAS